MNVMDVSLNFLNILKRRPQLFRKCSFKNHSIAMLGLGLAKQSFRKSPKLVTCAFSSSYSKHFLLQRQSKISQREYSSINKAF